MHPPLKCYILHLILTNPVKQSTENGSLHFLLNSLYFLSDFFWPSLQLTLGILCWRHTLCCRSTVCIAGASPSGRAGKSRPRSSQLRGKRRSFHTGWGGRGSLAGTYERCLTMLYSTRRRFSLPHHTYFHSFLYFSIFFLPQTTSCQ